MKNILRALLAEDEALNRQISAVTLARAGYEVVVVADGAAAVAAAAGTAFDLILLDVHMPHLNGPAAARAIRAVQTGRVPILALSASAFATDVAACLAAGMDGFLTKPLTVPALIEALRAVPMPIATVPLADDLIDPERLGLLAEELPGELLRASLAACLESLRQSAAALEAAHDRGAAGARAHKIAGTAATYGLAALHRSALAVEAAAKDPAADLDTPMAVLRSLIPQSQTALEKHVAALAKRDP